MSVEDEGLELDVLYTPSILKFRAAKKSSGQSLECVRKRTKQRKALIPESEGTKCFLVLSFY